MTEEKNTSSSATDKEKNEQHEESKEETKKEESLNQTKEGVKENVSVVNVDEPVENTESKLKDYSYLKPGMTVKVHQKIQEAGKKKDETKTRIQVFEGIILAIKNSGISKTITVRKVSNGIGVEKIFPIHLPTITNIEPMKQAKVRRAKLYHLRDHKKRLKERKISK